MDLRYLTLISLPSPHANRVQVMKMSEAFSRIVGFTLMVGSVKGGGRSVFRDYGVDREFPVREIYSSSARVLWPRAFFGSLALARAIGGEDDKTIYYIRDVLLAFFLCILSRRFRKKYFFELHSIGKYPSVIYGVIFRCARGIISTNNRKKEFLVREYNIPEQKVFVAPNGYDERLFESLPDRADARKRCELPDKKKIVLYSGSMQSWKGVDLIRQLARECTDILFVVVGGRKTAVSGNITHIERKPHNVVPLYLRAADLLIAPYDSAEDRVRRFFSPIKIFEYMASGTPVLATDVPSIREIAGDEAILYAKSYTDNDFKKAIVYGLSHGEEMEKRAKIAKQLVGRYTWSKRARAILNFVVAKI